MRSPKPAAAIIKENRFIFFSFIALMPEPHGVFVQRPYVLQTSEA
ncbi:hypothetical protein SDC9_170424 [bioreactor metagenome]|uniref:Uncharacterized protein n=1 Tax=bioreactor metagenome TaxID=1076179 RepID=A0A645GB79_9ZZZZ